MSTSGRNGAELWDALNSAGSMAGVTSGVEKMRQEERIRSVEIFHPIPIDAYCKLQ
jgi:hypothetical protein